MLLPHMPACLRACLPASLPSLSPSLPCVTIRSDGRVERGGGCRQTDRQTGRQTLQLNIVDAYMFIILYYYTRGARASMGLCVDVGVE